MTQYGKRLSTSSAETAFKTMDKVDTSTASEFSPTNTMYSDSAASNHSEVMQTMLKYKYAILEAHPVPKNIGGFAPIEMMDKTICAEKIGYREKKIPFRMRDDGDISRDLSMRSCISRDASARSMHSCLPAEMSLRGETSLRVLPREMSRRQRMQERQEQRASRRSLRSCGGEGRVTSPRNLDDWRLDFQDLKIDVPQSSPIKLGAMSVQVTRRATIVESDVPPLEQIQSWRQGNDESSGRGRSENRKTPTRGRDERSASRMSTNRSGAFSSRKERADFFIGLKKEKSGNRSPSPWQDRSVSPEPWGSKSPVSHRSNTSKQSSYSHFGKSGGWELDRQPEEKKPEPKKNPVFTKSETTDSLLGEAPAPFPGASRSFRKQDSLLGQAPPQRDRSLEPMAKLVDMSKVDVERFSREPSLEPTFRRYNSNLVSSRDCSLEPGSRNFRMAPMVYSREGSLEPSMTRFSRESSMEPQRLPRMHHSRSESLEPHRLPSGPPAGRKPRLNMKKKSDKKVDTDLALASQKLREMSSSSSSGFRPSTSRSVSPEPDRGRLLAAGPSGHGVGFFRPRSPARSCDDGWTRV